MDCQQCQEQLAAYVEGLLGRKEQHEVASHLQDCLRCRADAEEFRQLHIRLVKRGRELCQKPLNSLVMARIMRRKRRSVMLRRTGFAVAGAVAITLIVIGVWPGASQDSIGWADVVKQIQDVRTLTYWVTTEEDSGSGEQGARKKTKRFFFKDPGSSRIETYKIPNESSWPGPSSEDLVEVWINRWIVTPTKRENVFMRILPKRKRAFLNSNAWPGTIGRGPPGEAMRMWNEIEELTSDEAKKIGEQVMDGIRTVGFEIPAKVLPTRTGNPDGRTARIWVTRDTGIPVFVESEYLRLRRRGPPVRFRSIIDKIEWNIRLSDDLFEFPNLEGWDVSESRTETFEFSRTRMRGDVILEVGPRNGPVLLTESDFVREIRGVRVSESTRAGKKSKDLGVTLLLTKVGAEKLKAFLDVQPGARLIIDFNGEVQNELEIHPSPVGSRISRRSTLDERGNKMPRVGTGRRISTPEFTISIFDEKGNKTGGVSIVGNIIPLNITSLNVTPEEFEDRYLTSTP